MKTKIQIPLLALLCLPAISATAQVNYAVSGSYAYVTSSPNASGNTVIASTYNGYPVVGIEYSAFYSCTNLTSVTIPNSVTLIGGSAFEGCTSLTSVMIPNSVSSIGDRALYSCTSLTSVTIPNSVGNIGYSVFYLCTSLTSVTIPNSVTTIGDNAFLGCSSLTSVTIPNSITSIGSGAFFGCGLASVTIPNSITSIGPQAFTCSSLTNLSVGAANSTYSSLGGVLFNKAQTTLIQFPGGRGGNYAIPSSVTSIGYRAFFLCNNLASVTIPNSVTSITSYAFTSCTNLTSVTIPNSVTSIGYQAFYYCPSLTNFSVGAANSAYSSLDGVLFNKGQTLLIEFPPGRGGSYAIPSSVTNIGDYAFSYCKSLTSVTIPNSVTNIGRYAFEVCSSLTNVTIPNSVISLGSWAFYRCTSLTSVRIGNTVASMQLSFSYCTNLTNLTFLGNAPLLNSSSIGFNLAAGATVYYYYGTTGWGPTYGGLPTVMLGALAPQVGTAGAGVEPGGFGLTIRGVVNQTIVIEASTNLTNWQPIWTNTLSGVSTNFMDSQSQNHPHRFYRGRSN